MNIEIYDGQSIKFLHNDVNKRNVQQIFGIRFLNFKVTLIVYTCLNECYIKR